jgi:hypothetical protein
VDHPDELRRTHWTGVSGCVRSEERSDERSA